MVDTAIEPRRASHDREVLKTQLWQQYQAVRQATEALCRTLAIEDYVVQPRMEVSPTKWHIAHVTWFFETFVLKSHFTRFRPSPAIYAYLFNSYYNAAGVMHPRPQRGLASRPTVNQVYLYREQVDAMIQQLLETADEKTLNSVAPLIVLGCNHEQQHQELMLTDIKEVFWCNPVRPVYRQQKELPLADSAQLSWQHFDEGIYWIGHDGDGFCFDNESPRHRQFLESFALASRLVTNGEYLAFMEDGGYSRPELWLSLGWNTIKEKHWQAPQYWEQREGHWWTMTLGGMRELHRDEPVCHVSYFEADAYARWAQTRLATEAEWEVAAAETPLDGNFVEAGYFHPVTLQRSAAFNGLHQMFGDVWQWTQSAYSPYPGYQPAPGALGEYNGKFMCNQYVLRGASCATPRSHARRTYRNFWFPETRWQFVGIRLARDWRQG